MGQFEARYNGTGIPAEASSDVLIQNAACSSFGQQQTAAAVYPSDNQRNRRCARPTNSSRSGLVLAADFEYKNQSSGRAGRALPSENSSFNKDSHFIYC